MADMGKKKGAWKYKNLNIFITKRAFYGAKIKINSEHEILR